MPVIIEYTQNNNRYRILINHAVSFGNVDYPPEPDDQMIVTYDIDGRLAGGGYLVKKEKAIARVIT